jgi:hypothetical protein
MTRLRVWAMSVSSSDMTVLAMAFSILMSKEVNGTGRHSSKPTDL